jgi:hypothetical protein
MSDRPSELDRIVATGREVQIRSDRDRLGPGGPRRSRCRPTLLGHRYGGLGWAVDARLGTIRSSGIGGVTSAPSAHEIDVVERLYGFATDHQLAGYLLHCVTIALRSS